MKLRNKKTGEIVDYDFIPNAHSIAELNEEWEDYIPPKPLTEKKFHKAIRAWFEANKMTTCLYDKAKDCIYFKYSPDTSIDDTSVCLSFLQFDAFYKLEHRKSYNVAELCGEEIADECRE